MNVECRGSRGTALETNYDAIFLPIDWTYPSLTMTDYERTVLEHYQLATAYPVEWPAEKDHSDASDEEETKATSRSDIRSSKSRYSALVRATGDRKSLVPGSQRGDNGVETLVQRDEPDPLGSTDSVVRSLRQLGLPVHEDTRLRGLCIL